MVTTNTNARDPSFLQKLYTQLIGLSGGDAAYAQRAANTVKGGEVPAEVLMGAFMEHPFKSKLDIGKGVTGSPLKATLGTATNAIKAHPWASAGLGALGAANVAGIMDDDKIGGQLIGGIGGGLLAAAAKANPMTATAVGLGGGMLGSLFDKLRAKKELEQQTIYPQEY